MNWNRAAARTAIEALGLTGPNLRLAEYWLSLWKDERPPSRSSFDPDKVRDLLPGIALFEVRPDESVGCRLAGAAFKFRFGYEIAGRDWLDLTPAEQRGLRLERNTAIAVGAVCSGRRIDPDRGNSNRWFEDVQLPFDGVGENGALTYLHHSEWRPDEGELKLRRTRTGGPATAEEFRAFSIGRGREGEMGEPGSCLLRRSDKRANDDQVRAGHSLRTGQLESDTHTFRSVAGLAEALPMFKGAAVFVIAERPEFREFLTLLLESAGLRVTALASIGEQLRSPPHGIFIVSLSGISGADERESDARFAELCRQHSVIALASQGDVSSAVQAIRLGAMDALEVPFQTDQLLKGVERALERSHEAIASALGKYRSRAQIAQLTAREKEVFNLLAEGLKSKAIGEALDISNRTVDVHRAKITRKLKIKRMAELARLALEAQ